MNKIDKAVEWAVNIANDNSHGYDQANRWGPDYDCSSLVISAWQYAGVPVKDKGATYTGNMKKAFLACGFVEVPLTSRKKGDVLLSEKHHTAMMIDSKNLVQASINEQGKIVGGKNGDQTGKEICTRSYYRYSSGWDCCLRYVGGETVPSDPGYLKIGSRGDAVKKLQTNLNEFINSGLTVDGDFGKKTDAAVREFQKLNGIGVDGVVGPITQKALDSYSAKPWDGLVNTVSDPLRVRRSADIKSDVLRTIPKGSVHSFIGGATNGMYQLADKSGWCSASLIKKL